MIPEIMKELLKQEATENLKGAPPIHRMAGFIDFVIEEIKSFSSDYNLPKALVYDWFMDCFPKCFKDEEN